MDFIEGRNPVTEALSGGRDVDKIFVLKGATGSITKILAMARDKKIPIVEVEKQKLDSMSETKNHQGVIAFMPEVNYVSVDDILSLAKEKNEKPFIVIADEITDPHNLGAIIRSANGAGAHGIIIPKRRSVGLNSVVAKTSAGAILHTPVAKVSNVTACIKALKDKGIWVIGTDDKCKDTIYTADLSGPVAIVIGNEGEGIGRLVKENCDLLVKIPMQGEISSLNASVAAGIVLYEVLRRRMVK